MICSRSHESLENENDRSLGNQAGTGWIPVTCPKTSHLLGLKSLFGAGASHRSRAERPVACPLQKAVAALRRTVGRAAGQDHIKLKEESDERSEQSPQKPQSGYGSHRRVGDVHRRCPGQRRDGRGHPQRRQDPRRRGAGTPPASRDVPGERGRLSSCIWNLGFFPNDARKDCPFVLTAFTGWSSERCPGIGFLSRGDWEIGVLRNVEPPTRPRLECLRETGLILRCDRKVGNPFQTKQGSRPSRPDQEGRKGSEEGVPENLRVPLEGDRDFGELCGSHQGCQVPFRPPIPNVGLLLRRCSGKGLHLAMTGEPRGFSRVRAGFSSYDREFRLPLVLAQASPIFHSSCEGKLGIALE